MFKPSWLKVISALVATFILTRLFLNIANLQSSGNVLYFVFIPIFRYLLFLPAILFGVKYLIPLGSTIASPEFLILEFIYFYILIAIIIWLYRTFINKSITKPVSQPSNISNQETDKGLILLKRIKLLGEIWLGILALSFLIAFFSYKGYCESGFIFSNLEPCSFTTFYSQNMIFGNLFLSGLFVLFTLVIIIMYIVRLVRYAEKG
jgi:hypothetical protein